MKIQLKTYLEVEDLQRQLAAYLGSQVRSRNFMPTRGSRVLFLEVSPVSATERLIDAVFKSAAPVELARQGGVLELHAQDTRALTKVVTLLTKLSGSDMEASEPPQAGYVDLIEELSDRHAIMLNSARRGSPLAPGDSLLIYEVSPAPFAVLLANEIEKKHPELVLVDLQEVGKMGRIYLSGSRDQLQKARQQMERVLKKAS